MATVADAFVSLRLSPAAATELKAQTTAALEAGGRAGGVKGGAAAGSGFLSGFRKETARGMPGAGQSVATQMGATLGKATKAGALGLLALGGASLTMAANFQAGLTTLVTGAGESERNLGLVGQGIKRIARESGTATKELISGMYMIESAGFHGAAGLAVLQAAAEGAKLSNADLGTVANAVTTVMKDYGLGGEQATAATNALIATVARGKVHLGDLSTSLARVLPTAAALKIPIGQVGGAMATLTSEGTSARFAAMGLNAAILAMAAPSGIAGKAMKALGGSSAEVAGTLQKHGLIAALQMVSDLALKAGPKGSAAYVAAMKTMLGGTQGLRVGLQLTGSHMTDLQKNTDAVSGAFVRGGKNVTGWALAQKDARVKFDQFKATIETLAITIGQHLLPIAASVLDWLRKSNLIIPLVVTAIGLMTVAFIAQAVAIQATPIGWIADGIIALIAVMYLLRNKWGAIWQWIRDAFAGVVDKILDLFGMIIHGAAGAFGWMPLIGPGLKRAAEAFDRFRQRVNDAIRGIHDHTVSVKVQMAATAAGTKSGKFGARPLFAAARGLYVRDGQAGVDDQLIWAQRGELVVPPWAVRAGEVDHLRGRIPGFATGGQVGLSVAARTPSKALIQSTLRPPVLTLAEQFGQAMFRMMLAGGGGGGGAARWAGVILQALALLRQPPSWLGLVERRMNQESGGDPYAVNRWDINWQRGTPSVGLMQVIGPTFAAYGSYFRLVGPYLYGVSVNPLANTYAGLNYALHRYGTLAALGRPGGYGAGGLITEPIAGIGLRTGRAYTFGERGQPETVTPGVVSTARLERLTEKLIEEIRRLPGSTGAAFGHALGQVTRAGAHAGAYSPAWG